MTRTSHNTILHEWTQTHTYTRTSSEVSHSYMSTHKSTLCIHILISSTLLHRTVSIHIYIYIYISYIRIDIHAIYVWYHMYVYTRPKFCIKWKAWWCFHCWTLFCLYTPCLTGTMSVSAAVPWQYADWGVSLKPSSSWLPTYTSQSCIILHKSSVTGCIRCTT